MKDEIVKIRISNEHDIVLAYKRAKQLCEFCGMNVAVQTKFATAVSEICRNVLEHVGDGSIKFGIAEQGNLYLEATVTDKGRGISNVEEVINRDVNTLNTKGFGISNSKKLVDQFFIESSPDKGTRVRMRKKIAHNHPPINKSIVEGWKDFFANESSISPYEELKKQNMHYIEVTETLKLKKIESDLQLEEIKRLNTELDQFAYTITHDLKAPLNKMQTMLTVLLEDQDVQVNPAVSKSIAVVDKQVAAMQKLVLEILAYSKRGTYQINKSVVDVPKLIEEVLQTLRAPKNLDLIIGKMPLFFTEDIYLYQIFSNLLSNAIKYNDKPQCQITVECTKEEEGFVFSVADNGPGISKEDQKRFLTLYESSDDQTKDGTGVGLSIVQNILHKKNASMWVESDGKLGTKFLFSWPDQEVTV